jgi:hypothetical protein
MADTITIQTSSSTDVVKIIERGPQGPAGEGGGGDVESVNGQTGVVVLDASDVGAAETSHASQHEVGGSDVLELDSQQVLVDSVFLSTSVPNLAGIYLRNGVDNGKALYENAEYRSYFWWDSDLSKWFLANSSDVNLFESSQDTQFPWQSLPWTPISPQAGTVDVDQAQLFDVSDQSIGNPSLLRTAKSGNATSTELVLGSDTRLTDARTPTAHASTHHTGGSDAIAPNNIGAESLFTASGFTVSGTTTTLSAGRAQIVTIIALSATTINLPTTGNQYGDRLVIRGGSPVLGTITLSATLVSDTITAQGQQRSYVWQSTGTGDRWVLNSVDTHTHAAAAITSGVLDFDRIQQVLEVESDGTSGTPTEVDLTTNIVGGNLHALVVLLGADSEAYSKVVLPALGAAATGKVTVRVNEFEDPSDDFVQIVLDDDTAIFPASGYTEMDPDEELTFRWNNGRWDMDLRPNPSATTAVSIFKPNASGTLARTEDFAAPPAIGNTAAAAATFTTLTANTSLTLNGTGAAELVNGTSAAGPLQIYRTTANANADYERGFFRWGGTSSNTLLIGTEKLGTGAARALEFQTDGTTRLVIGASGNAANALRIGTGANIVTLARGDGVSVLDVAYGTNSYYQFYVSEYRFGGSGVGGPVFLFLDAADVLAQRRTTNAQEFRLYGSYTSASSYQRLAIKTKAVTLSALSGASVATTGGFIPDGAVLVGLTTRVSTAITGATGYDIGDGSDADRWGANIDIALNTASDNTNWTAGTIECFTTAQEVTLTAVGSNFTGGAVVIVAHYLAGEAD